MQEIWTDYSKSYIALAGHKTAFVRKHALPAGFLWQYNKKYGHAATLEEAKAWVEGLAVHFSIPAKQRWMTL